MATPCISNDHDGYPDAAEAIPEIIDDKKSLQYLDFNQPETSQTNNNVKFINILIFSLIICLSILFILGRTEYKRRM